MTPYTPRHQWAGAESNRPPTGPVRRPAWGAPAPDGDYDEPPPVTEPTARRRPPVRRAPPPPPPLEAQRAPQPLVIAELARVIVLLAVGTVWAIPLEDPVVDLLSGGVATLLGLAISWAATQITKGRVWALRKGVDTDRILSAALVNDREPS